MIKRLVDMITIVKVSADMALLAQDLLDAGAQGYAKVIGGNEYWLLLGTSTDITGYLTEDNEEEILNIMSTYNMPDDVLVSPVDYYVERDSIVKLIIPANLYK